MSILDFNMPGMDTPEGQGLMAAAMSLLQAQKMPGQRGMFANALGQAGQQYMQTRSAAADRQQEQLLRAQQLELAKANVARQRLIQQLSSGLLGGDPSAGAQPSAQPSAPAKVTPPQGVPSGANSLGFTPQQLAALKLNGIDLADIVKLTAPTPLGNGWIQDFNGNRYRLPELDKNLTLGPDNVVSVLPGTAESIAKIEGAKAGAQEGAKAATDVINVNMPDGTTQQMSRANFLKMTGGDAPQATQPAPQAAPQTAPALMNKGNANLTPAVLDLIRRDAAANGVQDPQININAPASGQTMDIARPRVGQSQTPQQAEQIKTKAAADRSINDSFMKTSYEPTIQAGDAAQGVIDSANAARAALFKLGGGGWGTELKANAANVLTGLGLAPKNAEMFAANAQVFQKTAMDRLWSALNAAKGPQTEGDAQRAAKTFASLANTPQANQYILDLVQAQAEREKLRARFYREALPIAQANGNLQEVDREWQKRSPSIFDMPTMRMYGGKK